MNHSEIVSFLWGVADLIRDTFKRGKYQDVILPLTVLRRLDCVLAHTKERVLRRQAELKGKGLEELGGQLRRASGFAFYNTSRYDFEKLLADAPHLAANLRNYIAGFSPNMREVLEKFDFDNTISKLDEAGLLFQVLEQVLERFKNVDLHPDRIDNPTMGTIFEELIRKFNEALNENPGEHFTPRDVVHLMVTVERPLRLNFQATPERIARLEGEKRFQALAQSQKKGTAGAKEQAEGRALQQKIRDLLRTLPSDLVKDRGEFEGGLDAAAKKAGAKLPAPARKAILSALAERDETAAVCRDPDGNPEPDPELRDAESVPLPAGDDPADADGVPASVRAFFDREVKPHVPDAWIDLGKRDPEDGRVGIVGYETNFNRYFYRYTPPRPLEEIEADIRAVEADIVRMLGEVTRGG